MSGCKDKRFLSPLQAYCIVGYDANVEMSFKCSAKTSRIPCKPE